jgi:hypothetical protein
MMCSSDKIVHPLITHQLLQEQKPLTDTLIQVSAATPPVTRAIIRLWPQFNSTLLKGS